MKNRSIAAGLLLAGMLLVVSCGQAPAGPSADPPASSVRPAESSSAKPADPSEKPAAGSPADSERTGLYTMISQEEAMEMMERDDGHVIVDVRRQDEYDAGHIPGAILIPNESITTEPPEELPDPDQIILIYCRSGNRSKQAAQKLADMGYTAVYEFGGIIDWTGEIVVEETNEETLQLLISGREMPVTWEDNPSVKALQNLVSEGELTIAMSMYGGFEQVGPIGKDLVRDDEQITTSAGDIVLYNNNQIVVFYGSNTWAYTRLGHIDLTAEEMTELLGKKDIILTLKMAG